jgi:hypothetical protein
LTLTSTLYGRAHVEEMPYLKMINSALPPDIQVLAWTTVPKEFSARYACASLCRVLTRTRSLALTRNRAARSSGSAPSTGCTSTSSWARALTWRYLHPLPRTRRFDCGLGRRNSVCSHARGTCLVTALCSECVMRPRDSRASTTIDTSARWTW